MDGIGASGFGLYKLLWVITPDGTDGILKKGESGMIIKLSPYDKR